MRTVAPCTPCIKGRGGARLLATKCKSIGTGREGNNLASDQYLPPLPPQPPEEPPPQEEPQEEPPRLLPFPLPLLSSSVSLLGPFWSMSSWSSNPGYGPGWNEMTVVRKYTSVPGSSSLVIALHFSQWCFPSRMAVWRHFHLKMPRVHKSCAVGQMTSVDRSGPSTAYHAPLVLNIHKR